ncbi:hypothetical protein HDV04_001084 [Boothiomyces sp. JEL0838]|nr:hypothetical protein HDV04_001084 [Boothiomyces sp. JEL0838]
MSESFGYKSSLRIYMDNSSALMSSFPKSANNANYCVLEYNQDIFKTYYLQQNYCVDDYYLCFGGNLYAFGESGCLGSPTIMPPGVYSNFTFSMTTITTGATTVSWIGYQPNELLLPDLNEPLCLFGVIMYAASLLLLILATLYYWREYRSTKRLLVLEFLILEIEFIAFTNNDYIYCGNPDDL